jgi:hypothetical protein
MAQTVHPDSYLVILDTYSQGKYPVCKVLCTACGSEAEKKKHHIFALGKHGRIKSCGCMKEKLISVSHCKSQCKIAPPGSKKHREYHTWIAMRDRCYNLRNPRFKDYGGRGITMHPEWVDDFVSFSTWIESNLGPRPDGHSLDRINNDLGYQPGNLRWASQKTQCNNTRRNILITHDGCTQTLKEWSRETGIHYETLRARIRQGLTPETGLFNHVR